MLYDLLVVEYIADSEWHRNIWSYLIPANVLSLTDVKVLDLVHEKIIWGTGRPGELPSLIKSVSSFGSPFEKDVPEEVLWACNSVLSALTLGKDPQYQDIDYVSKNWTQYLWDFSKQMSNFSVRNTYYISSNTYVVPN